ncbi:MAG TPA: hypothetical protein VMT18_11720 [Planctomycetota bacterium]|nr:hypothetical protein [Planctomycetota bacterium]
MHRLGVFLPLLLAAPAHSQVTSSGVGGANRDRHGLYQSNVVLPGKVVDLAPEPEGSLLYCTLEGTVGRIVPWAGHQVLATASSGPFPDQLRAVARAPDGDVAVLDAGGDVYVLPGGKAPAVLVYDDLHMIGDATDLIVDARGSFLIASATPSSGQRAVNWVSQDGQSWSYWLVKHQPVQLAHDPLTGGLLMAESSGGGALRLSVAGSPVHATNPLDTTTQPGLSAAADDGDLALEADGDIWWAAGTKVYKRDRAAGTTSLVATAPGPLAGVAIARSTPQVPGSAWSLWVAQGGYPTLVRELFAVNAPGTAIASDQGPVPNRGKKVNLNFGFQVFDLAADNQGRLLVGGTLWGGTQFVKRITLSPTPSIATVASSADGLLAPVEGLAVAPDDSIYVLARTGAIQRLTEGPLNLQTVYSDPGNAIAVAKDLALDVDGTLYIASREGWNFGQVTAVSGGVGSVLATTEESRGLAANPAGGMYVSQWRGTGFEGTVDLFQFASGTFQTQPGFVGMNYSNGDAWGDGDLCVAADGSVYTISEDDWSLVRYDAALDGLERIGSGFLNRPSGLAIAPSTANSGSTTGWSLYASEWDNLWEFPSSQPPASTLVNAALGVGFARTPVAGWHPSLGRPRALAPGPVPGTLLVADDAGVLREFAPANGALRELGLAPRGELDGPRSARVDGVWYVLDGWLVWRVGP